MGTFRFAGLGIFLLLAVQVPAARGQEKADGACGTGSAVAGARSSDGIEARIDELEARIDTLQRKLEEKCKVIDELRDAACRDTRPDGCDDEPAPPCEQPVTPGPCKAYIPRWHYSAADGRCRRFIYGGCGGNDNNFPSRATCNATCGEEREIEVPRCEQPIEKGPCKAYIPRWAHDPKAGRCVRFVYGGCGGTLNNFGSRAACEGACVEEPEPQPVCEQPLVAGPCKASIPRWYYNSTEDKCERFFYGGCLGNDNNFPTEAGCRTRCGAQPPNPCELEPDHGPCRAVIQRWAYMPFGRCVEFTYGGCGGNANNYLSEAACSDACAPPPVEVDKCALPAKPGPCEAYIPRWHYNNHNGRCESFIYGGCGSNENNFKTQGECARSCHPLDPTPTPQPCLQDFYAGDPDCTARSRLQWYWDEGKEQCVGFMYSGCNGNDNRFESAEECARVCDPEPDPGVCELEADPGTRTCVDASPEQRWYWNQADGTCAQFEYLGCEGNSNSFASQQACERVCGPERPERPVCGLPAVRGPCAALIERWYWDDAQSQCRRFTYGGCGGNANNFLSKDACEGSCAPPPSPTGTEVCRQAASKGPCDGYFLRWHYDEASKQCRTFVYGGCVGNGNNFLTEESCESTCGEPTADCEQPQDRGKCAASLERWFYDTTDRQCKLFTYTGCGGNGNNYESFAACQRACDATVNSRIPVCEQPAETGDCQGAFLRYFWDSESESCTQFVYGGCGGNANNFASQAECLTTCSGRLTSRIEAQG